MNKKELIKEYHLKELGKDKDEEVIEYLMDGEETPLKKDDRP